MNFDKLSKMFPSIREIRKFIKTYLLLKKKNQMQPLIKFEKEQKVRKAQ